MVKQQETDTDTEADSRQADQPLPSRPLTSHHSDLRVVLCAPPALSARPRPIGATCSLARSPVSARLPIRCNDDCMIISSSNENGRLVLDDRSMTSRALIPARTRAFWTALHYVHARDTGRVTWKCPRARRRRCAAQRFRTPRLETLPAVLLAGSSTTPRLSAGFLKARRATCRPQA